MDTGRVVPSERTMKMDLLTMRAAVLDARAQRALAVAQGGAEHVPALAPQGVLAGNPG